MKKKYIVIKILMLIMLIFIGCGKKTIKENEMNDIISNANIISESCIISGFINKANDVDCFKIDGNKFENNSLRADISPVNKIDFIIYYYYEGRLVKIVNDNGPGEPETLSDVNINKGNNYILLGEYSGENYSLQEKYNFEIEIRVHNDKYEIEPNDTIADANMSEINTTIYGYFSPGWNMVHEKIEQDWYKFDIQESDITISANLTGVPGIDSVISIYDSTGNLIKEIDGNGQDDNEAIKNLTFKETGVYYFKVNAKERAQFENSTPYKLSIKKVIHQSGYEMEPNDSLQEAYDINIGDSVRGYIEPLKDNDYYMISLDSRKKYVIRLELSPLQDIDEVIYLYDFLGDEIKSFNGGKENEAELVPNWGIEKRGGIVIRIGDLMNRGMNNFDYYILKVSGEEYNEKQEWEPNDYHEDATRIEIDETIKGYLFPEKDVDNYYLRCSTGKLFIRLSSIPLVKTKLMLYELESKNDFESPQLISVFDATDYKKSIKVSAPVKSGFYLISISSIAGVNGRDNYFFTSEVRD